MVLDVLVIKWKKRQWYCYSTYWRLSTVFSILLFAAWLSCHFSSSWGANVPLSWWNWTILNWTSTAAKTLNEKWGKAKKGVTLRVNIQSAVWPPPDFHPPNLLLLCGGLWMINKALCSYLICLMQTGIERNLQNPVRQGCFVCYKSSLSFIRVLPVISTSK